MLALLLALGLAVPAAVAAERPTDWTCDASGLLVCAGANTGGKVDCVLDGDQASCSWTFGQTLGAESPTGLPGEASFSWASTIETCLKEPNGPDETCTTVDDGGSGTCAWAPGTACVENLGPNPGGTATYTLDPGACLRVDIDLVATSQAWTPSTADSLASATHTASGFAAGEACTLVNR